MPTLSPVVTMFLGTLIRTGLTALSGILVTHNLMTLDNQAPFIAQMTTLALDALPGLVSLIWSLLQKARHHEEIKVALALPAGSTPADVKKVIEKQA